MPQDMMPKWRESLASVEARLPALVGDACLAVATVLYLGPLDGRERAAVLALWRDLLQQQGVPVSPPPFEFGAFIAERLPQVRGDAVCTGMPSSQGLRRVRAHASEGTCAWHVESCRLAVLHKGVHR